ncbi:hypothetical protein F2P81_015571 [Scophthalmus maximus]|uniref:Uncharacterized protein n=1 Tax=Scophthalmus maximus TaxID=52904 RepID=A0A6A4SQJ5_SCOMX|nr:hypothetical protein F2P81_025967 [Scophthalmus maximus]KAF0033281.1 hypothetical protein F2P81_015571 [Scophthalmus maximus]
MKSKVAGGGSVGACDWTAARRSKVVERRRSCGAAGGRGAVLTFNMRFGIRDSSAVDQMNSHRVSSGGKSTSRQTHGAK